MTPRQWLGQRLFTLSYLVNPGMVIVQNVEVSVDAGVAKIAIGSPGQPPQVRCSRFAGVEFVLVGRQTGFGL